MKVKLTFKPLLPKEVEIPDEYLAHLADASSKEMVIEYINDYWEELVGMEAEIDTLTVLP